MVQFIFVFICFKDYTARCFLFEIPKDLSFHLDTQREVNKGFIYFWWILLIF